MEESAEVVEEASEDGELSSGSESTSDDEEEVRRVIRHEIDLTFDEIF